jgi:xylose isomerase
MFSRTTVTLENAAHIKRRLDERGLECAMVSHGETVARGFPKALWTAPEAFDRRVAIEMALYSIKVARALDARGIYLFTALDGPDYSFQQNFRLARKYTIEALREICDAAGDLLVALEYRAHTPKGWSNIGSMSSTLDLAREVDRPNLGAQLEVAHTLLSHENLGQAAWDASRAGRLHHLHLNDTVIPTDIGTVFASIHFWECLELLYWLRESAYAGFLGIDCFWWRVDSAINATQQIQNIHFMLRVLDCLDDLAFRDALAQQDILATQHMLWQALRQAT